MNNISNYIDHPFFVFWHYQDNQPRNGEHNQQEIHTLADGSAYEGELLDGEPDGQGKRIWPAGGIDEGEFRKGKQHGQGKRIWPDGDMYEGDFLDDIPNGHGVFTNVDGSREEGEFRKGLLHGKGLRICADGTRKAGEFRYGKLHGQGIITSAEWKTVEGEFRKNNLNGRAICTWPNGDTLEGEFRNNDAHGEATYTCQGLTFTSEFRNGDAIVDASHISDTIFLGMLTQKSEVFAEGVYNLGIMADYILKKGYAAQGNDLKEAKKICFANDLSLRAVAALSEKIHATLQTPGNSKLLYLKSSDHGLGLQLIQKVEGFIDFEIYNSGNGLEHHRQHPKKENKFQTVWKKRVPLEAVTLDVLYPFLRVFANVDDIYNSISNISGATDIHDDPIVWQSEQKQNNCALMWIFTYLRNNMSAEEYTDMRLQLFQDCLLAVRNSDESNQQIYRKMLVHLNNKVTKLKKKRRSYQKQLRVLAPLKPPVIPTQPSPQAPSPFVNDSPEKQPDQGQAYTRTNRRHIRRRIA